MPNLIPHLIHQKFSRGERHGRLEGVVLFVDISGFTHLTDALMQYNRAGAEALTDALKRNFNPLITRVYENGGFVTTFAGDAFTAIFPRTVPNALQHALGTAHFVRRFFTRHARIETSYGDFNLDVGIGLSQGMLDWGILKGTGERYTYYFRGPAIRTSAEAQSHAKRGEIIGHATLNPLPTGYELRPTGKMNFHYVRIHAQPELAVFSTPATLSPEANKPFLWNPALQVPYEQLTAEFREVASAFISFEAPHIQLERWQQFVRETLNLTVDYDGYFNKLDFGDKGPIMLVLFGAPRGHENDLQRAVDFLLSLRHLTGQTGPRWRAGLTWGNVYAGTIGGEQRCEYTAIGNQVNLAARLAIHAAWGQVLVPTVVARSAAIQVAHLGNFRYKGFERPHGTYELLDRSDEDAITFEHPLIGRNEELARLTEAAAPIFKGRFAGVAYVHGDAGVGKSHLLYELRRTLQRSGPLEYFVGQTDQILRQAFNPFVYFLRPYFRQSPDVSEATNLKRFERQLDKLGQRMRHASLRPSAEVEALRQELHHVRSTLAALLGLYWENSLYASLDANLRYQNTIQALKTFLAAVSCVRPVLLQIEDFHALDSASRDTLVALSEGLSEHPVLILIASRYTDDGQRCTLSLRDDVPITEIELERLSGENVRRLAETILKGKITEELLNLLIQRTQGNPFFTQQFLYYFRENDLLIHRSDAVNGNAAWTVKPNVPSDVPTTINAILIARIDRLPPNVKAVVKAAAVLGREFDDRVLTYMLQSDVRPEVRVAEQEQIWTRLI